MSRLSWGGGELCSQQEGQGEGDGHLLIPFCAPGSGPGLFYVLSPNVNLAWRSRAWAPESAELG